MSENAEYYALLRRLERCLDDLDAIGAGAAAVHLSQAIAIFRLQFNLEGNSSSSE